MAMDDDAKLKITRSQLVDDTRRCSRVHMVSDRIYRNHLKTRFFNLQEQRKLNNKIVELEKLEQESWREMNFRRKELEKKSARIAQAIKINQVNNSPSITMRNTTSNTSVATRSTTRAAAHSRTSPQRRSVQLQESQDRRLVRKPSFTSLMKPYRIDDTEYKQVMGYAQHFTKKTTRKSSTIQTNIAFDDLDDYYYSHSQPHYSKSQVIIFRGLKKTAKGLVSKGFLPKRFVQKSPDVPTYREDVTQRRISTLPAPPNFKEKNARYIRIPGFPVHEKEDEDGNIPSFEDTRDHQTPAITYEQQLLSVDEVITPDNLPYKRRNSIHTDTAPNHLNPSLHNLGRRGSRSLCEVDMKRYLPYLGRCPSPINGLNVEFNDKLVLFNKNLDNLRHRDSIDAIPRTPADHAAPPPRDELGSILQKEEIFEDGNSVQHAATKKRAVTPMRISVIDRFELSPWRQSMAVHDTLPVIKTCKYIRNPSRERYDAESNQFYAINSEESDEDGEDMYPEIPPQLPGTRMFKVVQEALSQMRAIEEDFTVK